MDHPPTSIRSFRNRSDGFQPKDFVHAAIQAGIMAALLGFGTLVAPGQNPSRGRDAAVTMSTIPSGVSTSLFERITTGPVVQDTGQAIATAWGDYDHDGDIDLFVTHLRGHVNALYRNDGTNGFTRILNTPPVQIPGEHIGAGWGDYDNDGLLDLFVNDFNFGTRIYRNLGNGTFAASLDLTAAGGTTGAYAGGWADFDNDGRLDLLVSYGGGGNQAPEQLWRNHPDGRFVAVQNDPVVNSAGFSLGAGWGDYDNDRLPDLYVGNGWNEVGILFHNLGSGRFERNTRPPFDSQAATSSTVAWADYDNDGDLDLFVGHSSPQTSSLYRNDGTGGFSRISSSVLVQEQSPIVGAMWGDYDNDGWLDLYVANRGTRNFLYRNLRNGTFARIFNDPTVEDVHASNGCAWGDYNNDGFLDLVVANWDGQANDLFRNRGNANGWLKVQCQGNRSNASGIGAKVRLLARLQGVPIWQMREITSGDGWGSPELIAHFGLGDATSVERILIEWPSGQTQELTNIAPRQRIIANEGNSTPQLSIHPNGGTFTNQVVVTLRSATPNAAIRYTTDGSEPTLDSSPYSAPFTLAASTTVRARLFLNGFPASETFTAVFRAAPSVIIFPDGGDFTNRVDVAIVTRLPQTILRYTLDGTDPTSASAAITSLLPVTNSATIKVVAFFNNFPVSDVIAATFRRVFVFGADGIPAAWREQYFGGDFRYDPRAHQSADPDRDGSDNRQEFLAGSDPLDATSGLRVGIRALPELRFPTVPGVKYRILRRQSFSDPSTTVLQEITATGETIRFIDETADATPNGSFYLVEPLR
jgi:hypothetical protein